MRFYIISIFIILCCYINSNAGLSDLKKQQVMQDGDSNNQEQPMSISNHQVNLTVYSIDENELIKVVNSGECRDYIKKLNEKDQVESYKLNKKMAKDGNAAAEYCLSSLYDNGLGVHEDKDESLKCLIIASEKNNVDALIDLGSKYKNGNGVPRDINEALKLYTKAAEQGSSDAMDFIGETYLWGQDVPQDKIKAYYWLMKAAKKGYQIAHVHLELLCGQSPWACK